MASAIATHTADLVQKLANAMDDLRRFESVTAECRHAEDFQECWLLRNKLLAVSEEHWEQLSILLIREILPFVADLQKGVGHV